MKKTLLLLTAILGVNTTNAQLKVKAGTNISSITGSTNVRVSPNKNYTFDFNERTKSKTGFYAGLGYELFISDNFSVTPELIYNQMGANGKMVQNQKSTFEQDYLSLPIFFEYKLIDNLRFGLGLQINQLIQSKSKEEIVRTMPFTEEEITETTGSKNSEFFKKTNYGLTAGASYTFLKNFSVEARYYFGISNIYNEDKLPKMDGAVATANAKNQSIQIGLAYKFN